MTLTELQRLKEEAVRANSAYDAARKAYKAQQKAKTRTEGFTTGTGNVSSLRSGNRIVCGC